jgi:sporulation protein YlmC with PRC-barrel domain
MYTTMKPLLAAATILLLATSADAQTQQGTGMGHPAYGTGSPQPATQPAAQPPSQPAIQPGSMPPAAAPSATAPGTAAAGAAAGAQPLLVASDSLIGAKVRDPQGQDLGSVKQLMVEPQQGKIQYAVVAVGGVLGMNEKEVAVPWSSLKLARDENEVIVTAERQVLDQAPPTQAEVQEQMEERREQLEAQHEPAREGAEESNAAD